MELYDCRLLVGTYRRCLDSLIQVSRAAEHFCFWLHRVCRRCVGYESDAALIQQSSVVAEGSLSPWLSHFHCLVKGTLLLLMLWYLYPALQECVPLSQCVVSGRRCYFTQSLPNREFFLF